jgi:hypothetical protein
VSRFLTVEEVAERYRTNVTAIHKRTRLDAIPYMKRRGFRRLLFNAEHLDLWDAGCELETVTLPDGSKLVRPCKDTSSSSDFERLPASLPAARVRGIPLTGRAGQRTLSA